MMRVRRAERRAGSARLPLRRGWRGWPGWLKASMLAWACLLGAWSSLGAQVPPWLQDLVPRIDSLRTEWEIPGLAVVVVQGDSVRMARGFGTREAGRTAPVDARTLFAIGSTTKAFTSTAVAMLVDEGRLAWDDRVVDRLPDFRLADPWTTRELTLRDVLAHRSGLPMANFMWLPGQWDRGEMIRRLRHLEPSAGLRSAFTYQNVLYAAAGEVVAEAAGSSWAEFVDARILTPLGMDRTRARPGDPAGGENVATPHAPLDGPVVPVPFRNIDEVAPAGAMLSNAEEMGLWLKFHLSGGRAGDRELVSAATLAETHRPQIVLPRDGALAAFYPRARHASYAMGWTVTDYDGRLLLDHGGGIDGMTTLVALLPEEELGVAILTNRQLALPPYWLLYTLLDASLGLERRDWSERFRGLAEQMTGPPSPVRPTDASPPLAFPMYVGAYENPVLGRLEVTHEGTGLAFRLGRMGGQLEPWHRDTFRGAWTDRAWAAAAGPAWITFQLDPTGAVEGLVFEGVPGERWDFRR